MASKIDPRLLQQIQQLQRENQTLQGQVNTLKGSNNQGGTPSGLRIGIRGIFGGGVHNPRLGNSRISPLPARFQGRHLF